MNKRILIWCEVTCRKCSRVANASGYYSPERIKKLKAETKNWEANDDDYGILCPDCKNEVERVKLVRINAKKPHHCMCCGEYIEEEHLKVCDKCASEFKF